jgi:hypothetical protein
MRSGAEAFIGTVLIGIFIIFTAIFIFADKGEAQQSQTARQSELKDKQTFDPADIVTPVGGPSWLKQIGIFDIRASAMGEMGGYDPPPLSPRKEPVFPMETARSGGRMGMGGMMGRSYSNDRLSPSELERLMGERFFLAGSDLYRLDCRSCHGPDKNGSPPEINSLIGPFEGTSPALIEKRMKKLGRPVGSEMAKELASQAEENIRQRLQNGGKKMPPFRHLDRKEVDALFKYLKAYVRALNPKGKKSLLCNLFPVWASIW